VFDYDHFLIEICPNCSVLPCVSEMTELTDPFARAGQMDRLLLFLTDGWAIAFSREIGRLDADLDLNALIQTHDGYQGTLLHLCARLQHPGFFCLLPLRRIDPNVCDSDGSTVLETLYTCCYLVTAGDVPIRHQMLRAVIMDPRTDLARPFLLATVLLRDSSTGKAAWGLRGDGREYRSILPTLIASARPFIPEDMVYEPEHSSALLSDFLHSPAATYHRCARAFPETDAPSAEWFADFVLVCDGLLEIPAEEDNISLEGPGSTTMEAVRRVTRVASALPLELQMILARRCAGKTGNLILTRDLEPSLSFIVSSFAQEQ